MTRRGKAIEISERTAEQIVILSLDGRLTIEADYGLLLDAVQELIRQKKKAFVLDLEKVHSLDCAGIGLLVTSFCAVLESGGELCLLGVRENHRRMFEMAGLLDAMDVYEIERDALVALQGVANPRPSSEQRFPRPTALGSRAV